jgi:hypothetical protein
MDTQAVCFVHVPVEELTASIPARQVFRLLRVPDEIEIPQFGFITLNRVCETQLN